MSRIVSLFAPALEEHVRQHRALTGQSSKNFRIASQAPEGWVNIHFYNNAQDIYRNEPPLLTDRIKLNDDDYLELSKVRQLWNLENCVAMDIVRQKEYEAANDALSPVFIMVLSERTNAVNFIEREPSRYTHAIRALRSIFCLLVTVANILVRCFHKFFKEKAAREWRMTHEILKERGKEPSDKYLDEEDVMECYQSWWPFYMIIRDMIAYGVFLLPLLLLVKYVLVPIIFAI